MAEDKHICILDKDTDVTITHLAHPVKVIFNATKEMPSYNGQPNGSIITLMNLHAYECLIEYFPGNFELIEEEE